MSRGNIVAQGWVSRSAYQVTFEARDGDRTYEYDAVSGIAIAGGADPHDFPSHEVGASDSAQNFAEVEEFGEIEEVGELAELALLL
jgi:hypothetical protein